MAGFIDILRTGAWLTRERVRLVALALARRLRARRRLPDRHLGRAQRPLRPPARHRFFQRLCRRHLCARRPSRRRRSTPPGNSPASRRSSARPRNSTAGITRRSSSACRRCWRRCPIGWPLLVWQGVTLGLYLLSMRAILLIPPPLAGEGGQRSWPGGGKSQSIQVTPPDSALRASHPPLSGEG